jgi:hypothetical protein
LLAAKVEERKQAALHPTKPPKQASSLVAQAQATLLAVDAPPPQALCTIIHIKYCQTEALTCLIFVPSPRKAFTGSQHRMRLSQSNCNMRTSKKRRKKQSRVIPAGESHVNQ